MADFPNILSYLDGPSPKMAGVTKALHQLRDLLLYALLCC